MKIALLLRLDLGYCRHVLRGIHEYAARHENWVFRHAYPESEVIEPLREWKADGVIALAYDESFAKELQALSVPVVNTTSTMLERHFPLVEVDHEAVGRMAAEHFLERGFQRFGYYGSSKLGYSQGRLQGFRKRLAEAGYSVDTCDVDFRPYLPVKTSWYGVDQTTADWLGSIQKPIGVLASNDLVARDLSDMCRQLKLRVPGDVAILGVDNDECECHLSSPPLSSIRLPGRRIGFESAAMLHQLIQGQEPRSREMYFPPEQVMVRGSTDVLAIDDPILEAALAFIRNNYMNPIRVDDVTVAAAVSRRVLERHFHDKLRRTILEEIHQVRVDRAKSELVGTRDSMTAIAERCGFRDGRHMSVLFRKYVNVTPSAYRLSFRP